MIATKAKVKSSESGDWIYAPVLACDLDGTIRYNREEPDGYVDSPESVAVYDGVEEVLWNYREQGYLVIGVSNQGGVAYGLKSVSNARAEIEVMMQQFDRNPFFSVQLAFGHPGGDSAPHDYRSLRRKPNIGMLGVAEEDLFQNGYVPNWDESIMVGDRDEDRVLAERADIEFREASLFFNREN